MRVCPKCGHIDLAPWRQNRWRKNIDYMKRSEFQECYPILAKKLIDGHNIVVDEFFAYRLSGKGRWNRWIVERVYIKEYEAFGKKAFHVPMEFANHFEDPFQRKLLEVSK